MPLPGEVLGSANPMMPRSYFVIRSKSEADAKIRLQSDPILRTLKARGTPALLIDPSATATIPEAACVIFHYDDEPAVEVVRAATQQAQRLLSVCLCSDMYDLHRYLDLSAHVSIFVVPTELHRKVLMSQVYNPVYTLHECIDPIAKTGSPGPSPFPTKYSTRTLWFGYQESFYKGMNSLVPIIKRSVTEGKLASFELVLNKTGFENHYNLPTIPYSIQTFRSVAREFDYCILSHFSLDLAMNSYIKSPNKLITALAVGLIPICSASPGYEEVLREYGLGRFLFSSPRELGYVIERLDPVKDSETIIESGIVEALSERFSEEKIGREFTEILEDFVQRGRAEELATMPEIRPLPLGKRREDHVGLRAHLADLFPSAIRSVKSRLRVAG